MYILDTFGCRITLWYSLSCWNIINHYAQWRFAKERWLINQIPLQKKKKRIDKHSQDQVQECRSITSHYWNTPLTKIKGELTLLSVRQRDINLCVQIFANRGMVNSIPAPQGCNTLADIVALCIGSVGENMVLRRAVHLKEEKSSISSYVHTSCECLCFISVDNYYLLHTCLRYAK